MYNENLKFENLPFAMSQVLTKLEEIEASIASIQQQQSIKIDPEPFLYGIADLAKYLHVSIPTAQKIKNSGRFAVSQAERTIIIKKEDVINALILKKGKQKSKKM